MNDTQPDYRAAIEGLALSLLAEHEKIDAEHSTTITRGPRRGNLRYDREYNHGYRDALENVRMAIRDALDAIDREEEAR